MDGIDSFAWMPRNASHFLWLAKASNFISCDEPDEKKATFAKLMKNSPIALDPVRDVGRIKYEMGLVVGMRQIVCAEN